MYFTVRWHPDVDPAHAAARGILTGHAEIAGVFANQAEADHERREPAATAVEIDILAVRTLGLISLNDSLLRGPLTQRTTPVHVRMLLLDPDRGAVAIRAAEIGESPESFAAGIRLAIALQVHCGDRRRPARRVPPPVR
jgi:hypothetical protein